MKVFISYSSKDIESAKNICSYIENHGNKCFMAPRDIRAGYSYAEEIMRGIDEVDIVLLLLTENSNESTHVLREVERAVNAGLPILTYKSGEFTLSRSLEYFLMPYQWLNQEDDPSYERMMNGLKDMLSHHQSERAQNKEDSRKAKTNNSAKRGFRRWMLIPVCALIAFFAVGCFVLFREKKDKAEPEAVVTELAVGEYITFGTYADEPILWRVLKVEDGKALLLSDKIIAVMAYDAAESGHAYFNCAGEMETSAEPFAGVEQIEAKGSSRWSTSNLRTWLNSAEENVTYLDQAPILFAMGEAQNEYYGKPGFLNSFTEDEREALVPTLNHTVVYGEDKEEAGVDESTDLVFLLSSDELALLKEQGFSVYADPTQQAIEQDQSLYYQSYSLDLDITHLAWWLRDSKPGYQYVNMAVGNSYNAVELVDYISCYDCIGVRPAIVVDLKKLP